MQNGISNQIPELPFGDRVFFYVTNGSYPRVITLLVQRASVSRSKVPNCSFGDVCQLACSVQSLGQVGHFTFHLQS